MTPHSHLSDQQLLLNLEGELSPRDARAARDHLQECWQCRARGRELETAIDSFVSLHKRELDTRLPPAPGPLELFQAQLARAASEPGRPSHGWILPRRFAWLLAASFAACTILLGVFFLPSAARRLHARAPSQVVVTVPDSTLTPGATLLVSSRSICSQAIANNKLVPASLQRKVFDEYGIKEPEPRAYEVDYLITPALGGADDIHNLWPHSYSATVWNAQVKDALETRLHEMVCAGDLDLAEAQQEIASNWIAAYKKYFHTDQPLPEHFTPQHH